VGHSELEESDMAVDYEDRFRSLIIEREKINKETTELEESLRQLSTNMCERQQKVWEI
jgi:uncharacterized protein YeeX (DUF496 family)